MEITFSFFIKQLSIEEFWKFIFPPERTHTKKAKEMDKHEEISCNTLNILLNPKSRVLQVYGSDLGLINAVTIWNTVIT